MLKRIKLVCFVFVLCFVFTGGTSTVSAATTISLYKGQTKVLTVPNAKEKITWKTGNKKVVAVDKTGRIKATGKGTTKVTASFKNGVSKSIKITVKLCKHKYGKYKVTKKATCSEKGKSTAVCTVCGVAAKVKSIPKTAHSVKKWKVTTEATCSDKGCKEGVCSVCKKSVSAEIPCNDKHDWYVDDFKDSTCAEAGYNKYACFLCDEVYTETLGLSEEHEWVKGAITKEPTCGLDGEQEVACSVCGKTDVVSVPKTEKHDYGDKITKLPTCNETGLNTYPCKNCDYEYQEVVPKSTEHTWGTPTVAKAATCMAEGVKTYTCSVCGVTKEELIPKVAHSWNAGSVTAKATCEGKGVKTYTCTVCGETKEEEINATGHTWKLSTTYVAATCIAEGKGLYSCSVCSKTKEDTIEKTQHNYKATTVLPTCTEKGYTQYSCSICKNSYQDYNSYVPATGHKYTFTSTTPATTKSMGYDTYTCSGCKDKKQENYTYYDPVADASLQHSIQAAKDNMAVKDGVSFSASALYQWDGYGVGPASSLSKATVGSLLSYGVPEIGYGSFAFAFRVSDLIFGSKCPAKKVSGNANVQKGDIVVSSLAGGEHAYFVMSISGDTLTVAEASATTDIVKWGNTIDLSSVSYRITRYWD